MSTGGFNVGAAIMGGSKGLSGFIGNKMMEKNAVVAVAVHNHYQAAMQQMAHENHLDTIHDLHKRGLLTQGAHITSAGGHSFRMGDANEPDAPTAEAPAPALPEATPKPTMGRQFEAPQAITPPGKKQAKRNAQARAAKLKTFDTETAPKKPSVAPNVARTRRGVAR